LPTIQCGTICFQDVAAIIFDKDGTLADSQNYLKELGQKRAHLIDQQFSGLYDLLLSIWGFWDGVLNPAGLLAVGTRQENEIAAAACIAATGRDWLEALTLAKSAFTQADQGMNRKAECTPLFDGAEEMLRSLTHSGIKLAILSADTTPNVQDFIRCYHLESFIQVGMGIDCPPGKPHPAPLERVCAFLSLKPESVVMVGDSAADLEMAKAAGAIGSIGVSWGGVPAAVLEQADAVVSQFSEIQILPN
jgi:phosphoglycolate phosphatase